MRFLLTRPRGTLDLPKTIAPGDNRGGISDGGTWELAAARCLPVGGPELFFPVSATGKSLAQVSEAKAICTCCLVRRQCLTFALRTRQVHGIWGVLTEEERAKEARAWKANLEAINPPATA